MVARPFFVVNQIYHIYQTYNMYQVSLLKHSQLKYQYADMQSSNRLHASMLLFWDSTASGMCMFTSILLQVVTCKLGNTIKYSMHSHYQTQDAV